MEEAQTEPPHDHGLKDGVPWGRVSQGIALARELSQARKRETKLVGWLGTRIDNGTPAPPHQQHIRVMQSIVVWLVALMGAIRQWVRMLPSWWGDL